MGAFNTIPPNPYPPSSDQQGNGSGSQYELPIASAETLGGIKVGAGLSVNAETGELANTNPTPYTPPSFSTTVFDTGKKWIDGKNLFAGVVDLGNLPNATEKSVLAGLSNYNVLMVDGWYQGARVSNIFNLASLANFIYDVSTDSVVVNVGTDLSSFKAFAIIYCTEKESEVN